MHGYFDHAATAPLLPEAREAMLGVLDGEAGNASSLHAPGRRVRMLLEEARERCAAALGARVEEIVFTSGATESDNLAVLGTARLAPVGSRVLISGVEHPAVRQAADRLALEGYRVDTIPVDADGRVVGAADRITSDTCLVSVMAVNNEVGTEQPVADIAAACRVAGAPFHTDAVQAPGYQRLCPGEEGIDLLSLSGHKIGGAPGAGLLYVRRGRTLAPLLHGGGQEDSRRPGTENVPAIVALAVALESAAERAHLEAARLQGLRERLEAGVREIPGATPLGHGASRAPHISSWIFDGLAAESVLVALDLEGIAASSGSACSSHSIEPSPVLLAMGRTEAESRGLVRFSLGRTTTESDVGHLLAILPKVVQALQRHPRLEVAR